MAGPNLEVFKFGLYLFFPIVMMVQFGNPEWYNRNVLPYKDRIFPKDADTYKPPHAHKDVLAELERLKARRVARKQARESLARENAQMEEERLV
ncbi:hypothetical protein JB92DRAFT_2789748 [Gautieria morchelliformis]|nr:hypothetical protein JB92DRAFT_2789748 [Gautieria morchelliformis]